MKIINWNTIISHYTFEIINITQNDSKQLIVTIQNSQQEKFIMECLVEVFEVGEEQHYFELWKETNNQKEIENSATLIIEDSNWLERFSILKDNKSEFNHYVISGISKVIHLISETEPIFTKI